MYQETSTNFSIEIWMKSVSNLVLQFPDLGLQQLDLDRLLFPELGEPGVAVVQLDLHPADLVTQLTELALLRGLRVLQLFAGRRFDDF